MRMLSALVAALIPATAAAADLSSRLADEGPVLERRFEPPRVRVLRTASLSCVTCRSPGLPWGGLRKTYAVGLPWGGLPDYCPPVRAVRSTVVVTKG